MQVTRNNKQFSEAFLTSDATPGDRPLSSKREPEGMPPEFSKAFPEVLEGAEYIKSSLELVSSRQSFGALAVRIDGSPEDEGEKGGAHSAEALVETAEILDGACQDLEAAWGVLEPGIFGICLPGSGAMECRDLSDAVRNNVRSTGRASVSVGMAVFPAADFEKPEIFQNIIKALDHAEFFGPDSAVEFDAVSLNISGDKFYHRKDMDGAIGEYERALLLDSGNSNVYNSLGVCFAVKGMLDRAIDRFDMAAQLDPVDIMPVYNAGLVYRILGDNKRALEFFNKACETKNDVYEVLLETAKTLLDLGSPEKAEAILVRCTEIQPDSWPGFKHLGDALFMLRRFPESAKSYEKAVKLNPQEGESLSRLGEVYMEVGENDEIALAFANQSIALAPNNALFRFRLAKILEARKEYARAAAQYEKALEMGHPCREDFIRARDLYRS